MVPTAGVAPVVAGGGGAVVVGATVVVVVDVTTEVPTAALSKRGCGGRVPQATSTIRARAARR